MLGSSPVSEAAAVVGPELLSGASVVALDLAPEALDVARLHALEGGIAVDYRLQSVEELASEMPAQFDAVTCMEMLEHVPDPASVVQACAQLVKPGGRVFFSTINRNPKSYLFAILGAEYVLRMLPRGTHEFSKFIRPSELAAAIRSAGLILEDSMGLHFNPLTQKYWLAANVDVNYMMMARRPA